MSTPAISIVIPNYNRVGRLEAAIESVLRQDFEDLELLVVDDGSTDQTRELLERVAEREPAERFRAIYQENAGQAAALTRGWQEARADLLSYVNNDDYLLPGAAEEFVKAAAKHPDAEIFYPLFQHVDERGVVLDTSLPVETTLLDQFRNWVCHPGVGLTMRRTTFERLGGWNEDNWRCPDFEWFLRAGDIKYHVIPLVLGAWRMHEGSITVSQGGDELARVRSFLDLWESLVSEPGVLPPEVLEHANEALSSILITCGVMVGPAERFEIFDHLATSLSANGAQHAAEHANAQQQRIANLVVELTARRDADEQRAAQVAALRATTEHQATTIAALHERVHKLEDELREQLKQPAATIHPATARRPRWLSAARAITPQRLRDPVGAAVHRRILR